MELKKIIPLSLLFLLCTSFQTFGQGYRVKSIYQDINGIYTYQGEIGTIRAEGLFPFYKLTEANYYIGYRGCKTHWMIIQLPGGPTPEKMGGNRSTGDHPFARHFADRNAPPRHGWVAGQIPGVDKDTAINVEVIPMYDLTTNIEGSGTVSQDPTGTPHDVNTIVSLTANAAPGWNFNGWSGDLNGSASPVAITMDADKTITATFLEFGKYQLSVNTTGSGNVTIDPPGDSYNEGTTVTVTAQPEPYWVFGAWGGDLNGSTSPTTILMDDNKTISATFNQVDSDGDGVSDQVEDAGANGGDGNNDGTPDRLQKHVVCLHTFNQQHLVTLESVEGTTLSTALATSNPHPDDCPDWAVFSYDFFQFTITGVAQGGATTLTLHLPDTPGAAAPDAYYKYGPRPDDPSDQWYRFKYETTTNVGAQFAHRTIILHYIDGSIGDDDLTANGVIEDVSGPGVLTGSGNVPSGDQSPSPTPNGGGSGGGGGGCFVRSAE